MLWLFTSAAYAQDGREFQRLSEKLDKLNDQINILNLNIVSKNAEQDSQIFKLQIQEQELERQMIEVRQTAKEQTGLTQKEVIGYGGGAAALVTAVFVGIERMLRAIKNDPEEHHKGGG